MFLVEGVLAALLGAVGSIRWVILTSASTVREAAAAMIRGAKDSRYQYMTQGLAREV